jgi:hypothetical protein
MAIEHQLGMADPSQVAQASMACLDRMQMFRPGVQILASGVTFLEVCMRFGVAPQEALVYVNNLIRSQDGNLPEFRALRDYIKHELNTNKED